MLPSSPFDWGVKSKKSKVPEGMIWSGAAGKVVDMNSRLGLEAQAARAKGKPAKKYRKYGYRFTVAERCDRMAEKKTRNGKPFDKEQCIKNLTNKRLNKNW